MAVIKVCWSFLCAREENKKELKNLFIELFELHLALTFTTLDEISINLKNLNAKYID